MWSIQSIDHILCRCGSIQIVLTTYCVGVMRDAEAGPGRDIKHKIYGPLDLLVGRCDMHGLKDLLIFEISVQ